MSQKGQVCVTGAGGYIASWLVKLLLAKGYSVHGTVRDPDDKKNAHLKKLENASENLQLVKVNLLEYDSVHAAIAGCIGVFHVASPIPSGSVPNPEIELMEPAVTGTLNVLKACSEERVKRVVYVSSVGAVMLNPDWPQDKVKDEDCWSNKEYCKTTGNWYFLSKTAAESQAWEYAKGSGLDLVTVCPAGVLGPLLQPTLNASSLYFVSILKGVKDTTDNDGFSLVDVRDVADALLLTYEKPEAAGRYICGPHLIRKREMIEKMRNIYPNYNYPKNFIEVDREMNVSSEKLKKLGWIYRPLEETLADTIECYQEAGHLN